MSDLNNFNEPTIETNYLDLPDTVAANIRRAITHTIEAASNIPEGAIEFNRSARRFEEYLLGTWGELCNEYAINVEMVGGKTVAEITAENVGTLQPQIDSTNTALAAEVATRESEDARVTSDLTLIINTQAETIAALEARLIALETKAVTFETALLTKATLNADVRFNSVQTNQDIAAFTTAGDA